MSGVFVLMGSGETSPTMVELHKSLARKGGRVTVLDTPYGFQENADELTARALAYFRESVGVEADVVSLRTADAPAHETGAALARLAEADYVFCGPGSPTYALRQFRALGVADVLGRVIERGGVVCLASAASVTAGELSIPVYEIYKVGQSPYWEEGADVLGRLGLRATVVPHFNNTEGGTHDTSCCYVGRRRLAALRAEAPDLPVLGIDEHTAVVVDPGTGRAQVHGTGAVHVLAGDEEVHHPTGASFDLAEALVGGPLTVREREDEVRRTDLAQAVLDKDARGVVRALAEVAEADPSTAAVIAALAEPLERGWTDPDVALLLEARAQARADKQWQLSDLLRDGLAALGVVVEDTPEGQRVRRT